MVKQLKVLCRKNAKWISYSFVFMLGFFFGISTYVNFTIDAKWTDFVSLSFTAAGVVLGYITYFRWWRNKKKDDSYRVSKDYLNALNEVQEVIREIDFQYFYLCPAPGLPVEGDEVSFKRIKQVDQLSHQLYLCRVNLANVKSELNFWDVKLSAAFEKEHEELLKCLANLNVVMTGLSSQLFHYYKTHSNEYMTEIDRHKKMFNGYLKSIRDILNKRISLKFDGIFTFK